MDEFNNAVAAPKKSNVKYIVIAAAVLAVLILGYVFASGMLGGGSPKDIAFNALSDFIKDTSNPLDSEFGLSDITKKAQEQSEVSAKLVLESSDTVPMLNMFKGAYLNLKAASNGTSSLAEYGFGIGDKGLLSFIMQADDQKLTVAVPALMKDALEADLSGDLEAKMEASPLMSSMFGTNSAEFVKMLQQATSATYIQKFQAMPSFISNHKGLNKAWEDLKKSSTVTEVKGDFPATYNGKDVKANHYEIVFEKAEVVKFFETLRDIAFDDPEFKENVTDLLYSNLSMQASYGDTPTLEEMKADVTEAIENFKNSDEKVPTFAIETVNKKLSKLEVKTTADGKPLTITLLAKGGNCQSENMDITVGTDEGSLVITKTGGWDGKVYKGDFQLALQAAEIPDPISLNVNYDYDKSSKEGNFSIAATQSGVSAAELKVSGKYEDIKKGSGFKYVFNDAKLSMSGITYATLSGNLKLSTDKVETSSAQLDSMKKRDIFKLSEKDAEKLAAEISKNMEILQGSLFGGYM